MLSREASIEILSQHMDDAPGSPIDQAHDAVVERLGWRAFSDEALSLMASELLRLCDSAAVNTSNNIPSRRH